MRVMFFKRVNLTMESLNVNATPVSYRPSNKVLLLWVVVVSTIVLSGGYLYLSLRNAIKADQNEQIAAIGQLKVNQIKDWLDDCHSDISTLSNDSYFALDVQQWLRSGKRDRVQRERIIQRLSAFIEAHHYHTILIYDDRGQPVLRAGSYIEHEENMTESALRAMRATQIDFIDLHRHQDADLPIGLGFMSALRIEGQAVGAIYFSENPDTYLFPMIAAWPVNSQSAETQLVRAEGDDVLFLTKLRKRFDAPMTFSLPLNTPHLAAGRALLGEVGLMEHATDYAGEEVLSFALPVPGTPWVLVSKVSQQEAYALVDRIAWIGALLVTFGLSLGVGWVLQWRKRQQVLADTLLLNERVRFDDLRMESEKRFRMVFEHAALPMLRASLQGELIEVNNAWSQVFGYSVEEVAALHLTWQAITHPDDLEQSKDQVQQLLAGVIDEINFEKRYLRKDGKIVWGNVQASLARDEANQPLYFVTAIQDITEHKRAEQQVSFMAYHDKLTGLPNRALFFDRLSQAMSQARRTHKHVALLYLDLDGFKPVNDLYGHEAGDVVLKMVAQRLLACVRAVDTVARLGGDEFAVVVGELDTPAEIERVAEKILLAFDQTMALLDGQECKVGVSIGISVFPDNGDEMDSLVAAADAAMYESKHHGKNSYTYFGEHPEQTNDAEAWIVFDSAHHVGVVEIDEQHRELVKMVNRLNGAIKNKEGDQVIRQLYDEVIKYTHFHFETEHRLMERSAYPDMAAHDLEHETLMHEVRHFKTRLTQGAELLALQSVKDWLLNHIHFSDKALAKHLLAQGIH